MVRASNANKDAATSSHPFRLLGWVFLCTRVSVGEPMADPPFGFDEEEFAKVALPVMTAVFVSMLIVGALVVIAYWLS